MSHPGSATRRYGSVLSGVLVGAAAVGAVTAVLYPLSELDPGVSSGVLYVLCVLLLATYWGLWLGLLTSIVSALALEYFHSRPTGSFLQKEPSDLVAIGVLLLTAVVANVIADRARQRADEAEQRLLLEQELRARESEQVRLREVRASRARVLDAADRERRRVVRDLHDGAQQRLVQTVVTLKLAREQLGPGDRPARALVGEALAHAAAGLHRRAGTRLPPPVEATAYFVVEEALTNVAKHSRARRAWVTIAARDGCLVLQVRDDGVAGAVPGGRGLLGMEDRLAALDGRLAVESATGHGTVIAASIPLPGSAAGVPHVGQDGQDTTMLGGALLDI